MPLETEVKLRVDSHEPVRERLRDSLEVVRSEPKAEEPILGAQPSALGRGQSTEPSRATKRSSHRGSGKKRTRSS